MRSTADRSCRTRGRAAAQGRRTAPPDSSTGLPEGFTDHRDPRFTEHFGADADGTADHRHLPLGPASAPLPAGSLLQTLLAAFQELPPPPLQLRRRNPNLPAHLADVLAPQQPPHHLGLPLRALARHGALRPPGLGWARRALRAGGDHNSRHSGAIFSLIRHGVVAYGPNGKKRRSCNPS